MADMLTQDDEQKKSEPQPGASPTLAPTPDNNFGFGQTASVQQAPESAKITEGPGFAPQATSMSQGGQAPAPGSTQGYLENGLNTWLQQPSRYDAGVVQQGANVIQASLDKLRKQGKKSIGETMASRGLVGSSLEADQGRQFEEELQRQGGEQLFNLQREQANTYGADRAASVGAGLGFGNQSLSMLGMGMQNDLSYAQMAQDAGFQNRALQLQQQGMASDDAYRQAALEWQKQYGTSELGLRQKGIDSQNQLALATMLMGAPPELLSDPSIKAWIQSRFGGGAGVQAGGTSGGDYGFTPATNSGGNPYSGGTSDARYGFGTASMVAPQGGGSLPPYTPTTYTPPGFGQYQPVTTPAQPNYGVTQEAQRRLGMTGGGGFGFPQPGGAGGQTGGPMPGAGMPQAPMPNGVTSPIPSGGAQPTTPTGNDATFGPDSNYFHTRPDGTSYFDEAKLGAGTGGFGFQADPGLTYGNPADPTGAPLTQQQAQQVQSNLIRYTQGGSTRGVAQGGEASSIALSLAMDGNTGEFQNMWGQMDNDTRNDVVQGALAYNYVPALNALRQMGVAI